MTSRDFAFFLHGFFELRDPSQSITVEQAAVIQQHLALVFVHEIDPSMAAPPPKTEHEQKLDEVHAGVKPHPLAHMRPNHPGDLVIRC